MNNKKAMGAVGFILVVIIFAAIYFVGFAPLVSEMISDSLASSGTTGLVAFVFGNFNLWILLAIIATLFYSGGSG